jgi:exodeoxyribonuclease III
MIETQGVKVLGCYFPGQLDKIPFFEQCARLGATEAPFVLMGDVNTGHNDLDIEGNGEHFYCSGPTRHRNRGPDLFGGLSRETGLIDLWRTRHGDRQDWTWRSSKNGFRLDHVFANQAFIRRFPEFRCLIDHEPRETGLTDHSAVVLDA